LLRKQRNVWDMSFVASGKAALEEFAASPFDVVVSDMRMPGMDGAELLTRIRDLYPQAARIVLSGHAEREAIARVISVAHQFLSKPSDANTVRMVIERTCEFQSLMLDDGIRRVVGSLESLPSLPATYWELSRATENPQAGIADVARIVERDPAMGVKVLQLVNSAYFGLPQKTESILKAVTYLGVENLKSLLVATHVFGAENNPPVSGFSLDVLRDAGVRTANLARQIVRDRKCADAAFAAGVMHDVGQLVLIRDRTKCYEDVVRQARESDALLSVVEKDVLGITHGMVGAYLLGTWGLPFVLAETVAFHHEPAVVVEGNVEILAAVHLAANLIDAAMGNRDAPAEGSLDMAFLERAGLAADVPAWWDKARSTVETATSSN
jgi:HD-like signal output (HDOD) protein